MPWQSRSAGEAAGRESEAAPPVKSAHLDGGPGVVAPRGRPESPLPLAKDAPNRIPPSGDGRKREARGEEGTKSERGFSRTRAETADELERQAAVVRDGGVCARRPQSPRIGERTESKNGRAKAVIRPMPVRLFVLGYETGG